MVRLIIDGVSIQADLDGKVDLTGNQTISGEKTFANDTFFISELLVGSGNVNVLDELNGKVNLSGTETINGDKTFAGNIVVNNLTTTGTTTLLNTEQVLVEDNEIYLNSNVSGTPTLNAYFGVLRGSEAPATLTWDESSDRWEIGISGVTDSFAAFGAVTLITTVDDFELDVGQDYRAAVTNNFILTSDNYSANTAGYNFNFTPTGDSTIQAHNSLNIVAANFDVILDAEDDVQINAKDDVTINANYAIGSSGCRLFMNGTTGNASFETINNIFIEARYVANTSGVAVGMNGTGGEFNVEANNSSNFTVNNNTGQHFFGVPGGDAYFRRFSGSDMRLVITDSTFRPGIDFVIGSTVRGSIFNDGGGFATGSNNSVAVRAGGSIAGVHLPSGGTAWASHSDSRMKKNIIPIKYGLAEILQLEPKNYDMNEDESDDSCRVGFIAQDVLSIIPECVHGNGAEPDGKYSLIYQDFIPMYAKAIQELKAEKDAEIQSLLARIEALENA